MKKSTRIVKRTLALFLVVLMSINTFGAVVSDNDGSAFITKAEFDSMKNDFQSQIDKYNTSIDSKIDGAIAAYLSGIMVAKVSTENVIFKDWKSVSSVNYVFENIYQPLDLSCIWENKKWISSWNGSDTAYRSCFWHYAFLRLGRAASKKQQINVVDAGTEGNTITKAYVKWVGRALDYQDSMKVTLGNQTIGNYANVSSEWIWSYNNFFMCNIGKVSCPGFVANLDDAADTIWTPSVYSTCSNPAAYCVTPTTLSESLSTDIVLGEDSSNNTLEFTHIIHYGQFTSIICADNDWRNTLNASGQLKATNFTLVESKGQWAALNGKTGMNWCEIRNAKNIGTSYIGAYGSNTLDQNIPTIGLLNKSFESDEIYQFDEKVNVSIGTGNVELNPLSLSQGFCLLGAEKDARITWKPRFTNLFDDSKAAIDTKINIQFSTKPFSGTTTSSDAIVKVSVNGSALTDIATVEANNDLNIEWTMPQSGFIYITWWPEDSTIKSANWSIDLDLANCNTYKKELDL